MQVRGSRCCPIWDLLHIIIGKDVGRTSFKKREKQTLIALSEGIDKSKQVEERRLVYSFSCINKEGALPVIEKMNFDEVTRQYLIDAVSDLPGFILHPPH